MAKCKNVVDCGDWDYVHVDATGDLSAMYKIRLVFEKGSNVYSFDLDEANAKYIIKTLNTFYNRRWTTHKRR